MRCTILVAWALMKRSLPRAVGTCNSPEPEQDNVHSVLICLDCLDVDWCCLDIVLFLIAGHLQPLWPGESLTLPWEPNLHGQGELKRKWECHRMSRVSTKYNHPGIILFNFVTTSLTQQRWRWAQFDSPDLRSHGWIEANGMCRVACRSLKCKRSPMLEKQEKCFNELWENGTNYTLPY